MKVFFGSDSITTCLCHDFLRHPWKSYQGFGWEWKFHLVPGGHGRGTAQDELGGSSLEIWAGPASPFLNFGVKLLQQSWAPSIPISQNKSHFNPFFIHALDTNGMDAPTQAHPTQTGHPWQGRAAENAGALHVCCFHVRWFPRKPLALTCVSLNTLFAFIWISL